MSMYATEDLLTLLGRDKFDSKAIAHNHYHGKNELFLGICLSCRFVPKIMQGDVFLKY